MPDTKARLSWMGVRFSGSARDVSNKAVVILGLAAIIAFCVTAIAITLIIRLT